MSHPLNTERSTMTSTHTGRLLALAGIASLLAGPALAQDDSHYYFGISMQLAAHTFASRYGCHCSRATTLQSAAHAYTCCHGCCRIDTNS